MGGWHLDDAQEFDRLEELLLNVAQFVGCERLMELLDYWLKMESGEPEPPAQDGTLITWRELYEDKLAEIAKLVA